MTAETQPTVPRSAVTEVAPAPAGSCGTSGPGVRPRRGLGGREWALLQHGPVSAPVAVIAWPVRPVQARTVTGEVLVARDPLARLVAEAVTAVPRVALEHGWVVMGPPGRWAIVPGWVAGMSHEDEALRCEVPVRVETVLRARPGQALAGGAGAS